MTIEFIEFPKIARLSREVTITEKLDGTNAQVNIRLECDPETGAVRNYLEPGMDIQIHVDGCVAFLRVGSRTRWISTKDDNHGFARWAYAYAHELALLGVGSHFGEWWGLGIQRGYGQDRKRFSLFNTYRWANTSRPTCCDVVPILRQGIFDDLDVRATLDELSDGGSVAAPGFMKPEGVVIWHDAARMYFKKTIFKDEEWKGKNEQA